MICWELIVKSKNLWLRLGCCHCCKTYIKYPIEFKYLGGLNLIVLRKDNSVFYFIDQCNQIFELNWETWYTTVYKLL